MSTIGYQGQPAFRWHPDNDTPPPIERYPYQSPDYVSDVQTWMQYHPNYKSNEYKDPSFVFIPGVTPLNPANYKKGDNSDQYWDDRHAEKLHFYNLQRRG